MINCENNAAELYAIYQAVTWIESNIVVENDVKVHIFSDSRYSIDCLTEQTQISKHDIIVRKTQQSMMSMRTQATLHWIPSHIEIQTEHGYRRINGTP